MTRSLTTPPNNSSSASFTSVGSSTGFNAGEYIYNKNGDFGIVPDNGLTTGAFNIPAPNLTNYNNMTGGIASVYNPLPNAGGASVSNRCSAVLSNGNIVFVFANEGNLHPSFRIDTPARVQVVNTTDMSGTFICASTTIGVVALSGGGFAAYWSNSAGGTVNSVNYAIYSNAGVVVTTAVQDNASGLSLNATAPIMSGVTLPNGGFVLSFISTSNLMQYRIYGSTGTALYVWTSLSTARAQYFSIGARSDSSFCIAFPSTSILMQYSIISATNTSIVASTFAFSTSGVATTAVGTLTNDTFVIAYESSTLPRFRLLPTGNTLGSEFTVALPTGTNVGTTAAGSISVIGLSTANFCYVFNDNKGIINYAFYSSAAVLQSGAKQMFEQFVYNSVGLSANGISLIDLTTSVMVMFPNGSNGGRQSTTLREQAYFQISTSTYTALNLGVSYTGSVGSQVTPVSGYARNVSTPNNAYFYSSTTQTLTQNSTLVSTITPTIVDIVVSTSVSSCTLNNGAGFVIAYQTNANGPYKFAVYDATGSLIRIVTTAFNSVTSVQNTSIRVTTMTSGNIALAMAGSGIVNLAIYTLTGTLVSSTYVSSTTNNTSGDFSVSIAAISGDRFVAGWTDNTSYNGWNVYSNTCTLLVTNYDPSGYFGNTASVTAINTQPGFWSSFWTSGTTNKHTFYWRETSTNSFSYTADVTQTGNTYAYGSGIAVNSNNVMCSINGTSGTNYIIQSRTSANNFSTQLNITTATSVNSFAATNVGVSAQGTFVTAYTQTSTSGTLFNLMSASGTDIVSTGTLATNAASSPSPTLTALYGPYMVFAYINNTNNPVFAIICVNDSTFTTNITSGVTVSATALATSPNTGYTFAGVSTSSIPAGGSTQIQTNGLARLNSSYNAAQPTVYFDSTNPVGLGAKGFVNGLNVNIQGNT